MMARKAGLAAGSKINRLCFGRFERIHLKLALLGMVKLGTFEIVARKLQFQQNFVKINYDLFPFEINITLNLLNYRIYFTHQMIQVHLTINTKKYIKFEINSLLKSC